MIVIIYSAADICDLKFWSDPMSDRQSDTQVQ